MNFVGSFVRVSATATLMFVTLILAACGGSSSTPAATGALSGNWQINLVQNYPLPTTQLSVSGFVVQSDNNLSGNVEVPSTSATYLFHCGGVAPLTGTVSGQSVTFSLSVGGTVEEFSGTLGADGTSMTGSYQAVGGACFPGTSTTGTFTSLLVPPLNGNFTGTIDSLYMETLTGATAAVPVTVSGSFTQSPNAGGSNATLTGTITAVNYPCFTTATMTGTISGQNVYLDLYGYNGEQIGTLGQPAGGAGNIPSPATVVISSTGLSLVDTSTAGLTLGVITNNGASGPCPPLQNPNVGPAIVGDDANVSFTFE